MKKGSIFLLAGILAAMILIVSGCKKSTVPEITTIAITEITPTSAVSGGVIVTDGGEEILEKGVCWSTDPDPEISDSRTSDGASPEDFVSTMAGLTAATTYHVRAFATNAIGTGYGADVSFTTNQITGATVTTTEASAVTSTTAVAGGIVTADGGGNVTAKGICWNTSPNPTITNNKTINGTGTGTFTSNITELTDGTVYYYRAYANNSFGTTYGQEYQFITPVTDIEGNVYKTVAIDGKIWMAENLKTTKYNDDTAIPIITDNTIWSTVNNPGYCWYLNDEAYNKPLYGALYNWYAVNTNKLCPTGWHAPTDTEYNTLELYLGMAADQVDLWGWRGTDHGSKLKNTTGWSSGENGTNTSGFAALPGGYRNHQTGEFSGRDILSYWWSTSDDSANGKPEVAWYRRLDGDNTGVYKASTGKNAGKYVRCVKD